MEIRIKQEGAKVLLSIDNGRQFPIPWQDAITVSKQLFTIAKMAEEYDSVNRIIDDGSILLKAGWNIGLTNNKKIQNEIGKEAAWGKYNKYMGFGVKRQSHVGTPGLFHT